MVFYRKYRPQKIEDLDSQEIRDRLYSVLKNPSIPHAFLFTGPKGLGKTSTARIVAKAINCERLADSTSHVAKKKEKTFAISDRPTATSTVEPCNKCDHCISITSGTNMDVLEIDGASNRGIDEIRDLREKVRLSPLNSKKKVYIIDEVHMLTTEAFNALLKTLEEPPSHVVFILCTTEPHKVPSTILSRCLHVQFKKATKEELVRSFERILKSEKIQADKEVLHSIARLSDGSFRDGVKILEELVSLAKDNKITKELIEEKYQVASVQYQVAQMIKFLEIKDTKSALESVAKLESDGVSMDFFIKEIIQTLHNTLLFKVGVTSIGKNLELTMETSKLEMGEIKKLIEILSEAYSQLKYAVLSQIPLELAIVEWGLWQPQKNAEQVVPAEPRKPIIQRSSASGSASFSEITNVKKEVATSNPQIINTQQDMTKYSENDALWHALIDKIKVYNHSVAGVLRGCNIKSYDGKSLVIETNFKFHRDKLSEQKTFNVLRDACREIAKKEIDVSVILKGGENKK